MDPVTILAGVLPVLVEAGKAAVNRWVAPDFIKPKTAAEYAEIKRVDVEMFKALNEAGGSSPTYPWVEAAVKLMRPTVSVIVLGTWAYVHLMMGLPDTTAVDNFAAAIGFYLFGDRTLFYAKKGM